MGRALRFLWVPLCALILVTVGCEAGDGTGEDDAPGDGAGGSGPCLVGATQACDCPDGGQGAQTCVFAIADCGGAAEDGADNACPDPIPTEFEPCVCGDGGDSPLALPGDCELDETVLSVDSNGDPCSHKPLSGWEAIPGSDWGQKKYKEVGTGLDCRNYAISQYCPDQMGAWKDIYCFADCDEEPPGPEPCDTGWACGDLCLEQNQVCDGTPDCEDGSDEGAELCLPPCGDGVCELGLENSTICPEDCPVDNPCAPLDNLAPHIQDCSGVCLPEVMVGDGACDPSFQCADLDWDGGDCVMCEEDAVCDDGDPCNGEEVCTGDLQCAEGEAPDCDDGDPTTTCACLPEVGCACKPIECAEEEWKCADGTQCVSKSALCDESAECADASDESEDLCAPECGDGVCSLLEVKGQEHFCIGDCVGEPCGGAEGAVYDCAGDCYAPSPSGEYGGGEPGDGLCHDDCPLEGLNAVLSGPFPFSDPDKVMLGIFGCHEYEAEQCWWLEDDPEDGPWMECFPDLGSFYGPDWNCPAFEWDGGDCLASCDPDEGCDDGDVCNGAETCEALSDGQTVCVPGEVLPCGDDVDCTVDFCDPEAQACVHKPDHAACDDDDPTTTDTCDPGAGCGSVDLTCPPGFWECADGTGCIASGDICDGSAECADGSDEVVGCPTDDGCGEGYFQCVGRQVEQDQICIQDAQVCDGALECDGEGVDESSETCCGNGECVP
ncbi:MAG: hypothetical protein VX938_10120, partial [Myxococcota bacterium]|nr:hypothetical protein [Myxococcota bacterium]